MLFGLFVKFVVKKITLVVKNHYFCKMKNSILTLVFCVLLLAVLFSCGNSNSPRKRSHYVIASLRGPSSLGMLQLIDSLNNTENATVEIVILNEPLQVRKMMLDGSADFAVLPTTMAALLYNKGVDYRLAAISTWGTLYLCGNDTTIHTWNDLRHNKIHLMAKNMTPDVLFRYLLKKNRLEPYQDVDLDYRFPNHIDLANATTAGIAPMSVLSEPYLSYAMIKNDNIHIIMSLHDEWEKVEGFEMPETAFICKGDLAEDNPQLVEKIVSIYEKSVGWANENVDDAAALAVKYEIVGDESAARNAIPRSNLRVARSEDVKDLVVNYLNAFHKMDSAIIGGKMPDEKFY